MRNLFLSACLFGLLALFFVSCGGYAGAPGSTGGDDTNIFWEETEITPKDLQAAISNVDIADSTDVTCAEGVAPVERDHLADITFRARKIWANREAGDQIITGFTIDYEPITAGAPAVAQISNSIHVTVTISNTGEGEATLSGAMFFDAARKAAFDRSAAASFPRYRAVYTFTGHDSFGNPFSFKGEAEFTVGIFKNCQAQLQDNTPPPVPSGLVANAVSPNQVNLFWAAVNATDLAGYRVRRNGSVVGTAIANVFADIGLENSTTYIYNVTSFDTSGNESARSENAEATTPP